MILILFTSSGFATYLELMISIWRTNELGVDKTESTFGDTDSPWIVPRSGWDELMNEYYSDILEAISTFQMDKLTYPWHPQPVYHD